MQKHTRTATDADNREPTEHGNQPVEDESDFPSTPPANPDSGAEEGNRSYPPGGIPNPMPGVDPQQAPGIDGPSPIATPTDDDRPG